MKLHIVSNQIARRATIAKCNALCGRFRAQHVLQTIEQASKSVKTGFEIVRDNRNRQNYYCDERPMDNMKNILAMLLCSTCLATSATETLQRQRLEANWEWQLSRRAIDTQNTKATLKADSIIACSASCSSRIDDKEYEEGVSLYFVKETETCYCNMAVDTSPENETMAEIYYGTLTKLVKKEQDDEQVTVITTEWPYPSDCLRLYQAEHKDDGVYRIDPIGGAPTDTWCDMTNGGWTVIQRRKDGSEDFYRGWSDYANGFGNKTGEYWLGLEITHHLTQSGSHLEIFLEAFPGETPQSLTANYSSFVVGDSASNYTLYVTGFAGSCADSLAWHNNNQFSTYDNDAYTLNCAVIYGGAWWYTYCHFSHLNGVYCHTAECEGGKGIVWAQCWGLDRSAKTSVMKIRPL